MAEAGTTATPPAASGGTIDQEALARALAPAIGAAVAEAMKPMLAAAQPQQQQAAGGDAGKAKPLSLDDVGRVVQEQLRTFQTSQQQTQARQDYQAGKLKDLPPVYRNQLGSDPAKWAAEEQAIRDQYKADFKSAGGTAPSVGGENPGGAAPGQAAGNVDLSKLSPTQAIALGVKQSHAARGNVTPAATAQTAGGPAGATTATGTGQVAGGTAGAQPAAPALQAAM